MFWIEDARYCKIWKVFETADKYADVSIGTSEKDQDDEWHNSRWPARLIGHAFNQFKNGDVEEGQTVTIARGKLTNESYQDDDGNWKTYLRLLVMDFDLGEEEEEKPPKKTTAKKADAKKTTKSTKPAKPDPAAAASADDGDLPW